ncbi:UPAR/Ly6 domain-containing protein crok-like [Babylonia areolata]|uniref:UPAR/Ly6 domain-containing protein crok-like n=1 Tax=Babylonia areolata TaxID=304850 RepID=UPI003FD237EB
MAARFLWVIAVCVVAGFLFLDTGVAIKCFNCNSAHQADCADWFDNVTNHLVECFSWQTKCRKIVQEAWFNDHWDIRYIRQCAGDDSYVGPMQGKVCLERYGTYNVRIRYCHCDNQDGCNSAPVVTSWNMAGIGRTLALALFGVLGAEVMVSHRMIG